MSEKNSDTLFEHPLGTVPAFVFDDAVARVFPDMIERSVPGYATVVAISGMLAGEFSISGTMLYDLGCSLGAATVSMARSAAPHCKVVAVDNSPAMIAQLAKILSQFDTPLPVVPRCEDVRVSEIKNASVVALNYTLQFVAREQRDDLLAKIYAGMLEGGALILSEKIMFENQSDDELFVRLHHQFKRANGYSDLEISQKREALENVLVPESLAVHRQRLRSVGFQRVETWFQCFNFVSLIAIK
ncbi:MAG: carboxy-S-adenosyl-L-methionine synthase CmoA [Pseudomonadales bacterium]